MAIPQIIVTPIAPNVLLSASDIEINDTGGYYTATNVEGALQELGSTAADPYDSTKYFGDPTVDGSWRMRVNINDFIVERRESGVWIEKGSFTA